MNMKQFIQNCNLKNEKGEHTMKRRKNLLAFLLISLGLIMAAESALAEEKSADEIAKELSNPAGALASLNFNLQYTEFTGALPGSDDQESTSVIFQPALPFPVGDKGRKIIFRPAVSLPMMPVMKPMITKVATELTIRIMGRYSTPNRLRKAASAKLLKTMPEERMRKRRIADQMNRLISSW